MRLNTLKNKYPDAVVNCKKGGCCFVDFLVKVAPHSGELKFSRGNTDESSSSEQSLGQLSQCEDVDDHKLKVSSINSRDCVETSVSLPLNI